MAKSKLFIEYNSRNIGLEDIIPNGRFIRFSKRRNSKYIIVLIQYLNQKWFYERTILEINFPYLFCILQETIVSHDYEVLTTKKYFSNFPYENFVHTRLVCDFNPLSSTWTENIEKTGAYNDLDNIL
jgi:hypothetical protein